MSRRPTTLILACIFLWALFLFYAPTTSQGSDELETSIRTCGEILADHRDLHKTIIEKRKELLAIEGRLKKTTSRKDNVWREFQKASDFYTSLMNQREMFREEKAEMKENREWAKNEALWGEGIRVVADAMYRVGSKGAQLLTASKKGYQDAVEGTYKMANLPKVAAAQQLTFKSTEMMVMDDVNQGAQWLAGTGNIESPTSKKIIDQTISKEVGILKGALAQKAIDGKIDPADLSPDARDLLWTAADFTQNWADKRAKQAIEETKKARKKFHQFFLQNHRKLMNTRNMIQKQRETIDDIQDDLNRLRENVDDLEEEKKTLESDLKSLEARLSSMKDEAMSCYLKNDEVLMQPAPDQEIDDAGAPGKELMKAVKAGDLAEIRNLLAEGFDPNWRNSEGYTPLMWAARSGNLTVVEMLLDSQASPNVQNAAGNTALMFASLEGYVGIVKTLLEAGADPTIRNGEGRSALDAAEQNGHQQVVRTLLAEPTIQEDERYRRDHYEQDDHPGQIGQPEQDDQAEDDDQSDDHQTAGDELPDEDDGQIIRGK